MITHFDVFLPDAPGLPPTEFTLYYSQDEDWVYHAMLTATPQLRTVTPGITEEFVASFMATVDSGKNALMHKAHWEAMKWVRATTKFEVKS